jgi:hypothetical protein
MVAIWMRIETKRSYPRTVSTANIVVRLSTTTLLRFQ